MKLMGEDLRVGIERVREAARCSVRLPAIGTLFSPISLALAGLLVVGACGSSAREANATSFARDVVEIAHRIGDIEVRRGWHDPLGERHDASDHLEGARGARLSTIATF